METSNNQRLDEQQRQLDFEGTQLDWRQRQLDFEQLFHQGQESVWEFRKRQQQIEFERHLLQGRQILLDFRKRLDEIPRKMKQNDELVKQMQESGSQIVPTSQDSAPPASTDGGLPTPDVANLDEVQSCQEKDGALFVTTEQIEASEISDRWGEIKLVPMEDHDDSSAPGIKATTADEKRIEVPIANANLGIQIQIGSERDDAKKPPNSEILEPSKVKSDPFETPPIDYTAENLGDLVVLLIELMEIRLVSTKNVSGTGLRIDSIASLRNLMSAHKVFVKMPTRTDFRADALGLNFSRFKPRIDDDFGIEQGPKANSWPYDRGKGVIACLVEVKTDGRPRPIDAFVVVGKLFQSVSSGCWCGAERMDLHWNSDCILTFDPGGVGSVFRYMRQQMELCG